ncbi:hypothetical protein QBC41DRAFT_336520 [Cercophora samala]|uniref:Secreted protein n=1 Tax=Cercophora samala TaxID=330535 RepID=A0AA39ZF70_9PEZI|nr:hypothetical protein QBC41DRAFT_336520 [Cercophora samala]
MFSSAINACSVLLALSGLALGLPNVAEDPDAGPPSGYGIVPIEWDVPVNLTAPDSTTVHLSGTIQDVVAQMEHDYPGWNETFQQMNTTLSNDTLAMAFGHQSYEVDKMVCEPKWKYMANRQRIWEGIEYLLYLPADPKPKNGPGPGNCGRVSCSYHAAIYWCNDNKEDKELSSWKSIAVGAFQLYSNCKYEPYDRCGGQLFYKDNWNVIVKKDIC